MNRDMGTALAVVVLAAGVAIALPAALIIVALQPTANSADAELIGVIATITAGVVGALGGYLARGQHNGHVQPPVVPRQPPGPP